MTDFFSPSNKQARSVLRYVAIALLLIFSPSSRAASPDALEIYVREDRNSFFVVNSGTAPILILGVSINDRSDCQTGNAVSGLAGSMTDPLTFLPREIKVGEQMLVYSRLGTNGKGCKLVQAEVKTDQGSKTFTFIPFLSERGTSN